MIEYVEIGKVASVYTDTEDRSWEPIIWTVRVSRHGYVHLNPSSSSEQFSAHAASEIAALLLKAVDKIPAIVKAFRDNDILDEEVAQAKARRIAALTEKDTDQ